MSRPGSSITSWVETKDMKETLVYLQSNNSAHYGLAVLHRIAVAEVNAGEVSALVPVSPEDQFHPNMYK